MKNSYTPQELLVLRNFGRRIRILRHLRDLTQESLAEAANLNRNYLSDVERGTRNISLINLHHLARALGLSLRDMLVDDNDAKP